MSLESMNAKRRMVAFIPGTGFVEGHGYRVAFATEGEEGFRWTGTWPYSGGPGEVMPWFWGPTLAEAQEAARVFNERMGISAAEALRIVGTTFPRRRRAVS